MEERNSLYSSYVRYKQAMAEQQVYCVPFEVWCDWHDEEEGEYEYEADYGDDYEDYSSQYDDDPNPYHGDYSED